MTSAGLSIAAMAAFLDSMGGGAWPFLVGGAICLVNSDNERDFNLLNSRLVLCARSGRGFYCFFME